MADLILHDGREVDIDLYKVTRKEYGDFYKPDATMDEENIFIAKVTGLSIEDVQKLPLPDFDAVVRSVGLKRRELAANPS